MHTKKHISGFRLLVLLIIAASCNLSCENYDDLKPGLRKQIIAIEKTIDGIRKAGNAEQMSAALSPFNAAMGDIILEWRAVRKKYPELKNLYTNPPSSLNAEITKIRHLNTTLKDSLVLTAHHSDNAGLRRRLMETINLINSLDYE